MLCHDEVEGVFNALKQDFTIIDVKIEFPFNCVVNQDTEANIEFVGFRVPMRFESDRHAVPSLGIDMAKSITATLDKSFDDNVGLY